MTGVTEGAPEPAGERSEERLRVLAEQLSGALERGDHAAAEQAITALGECRQEQFVAELAKCVRNLHDALNSFQFDGDLARISAEIPDAKDRLGYVITLTEQAANRSLEAVEDGLPVVEDLRRQAGDMAVWLESEVPADSLRSAELEFVRFAGAAAERLGHNLSEVLMAQEFQDLTGQMIRRVITLVQDVEDGLVSLIRATHPAGAQRPATEAEDEHAELMRGQGPQLPGQQKDVYNSQDEVDDLLASLGF